VSKFERRRFDDAPLKVESLILQENNNNNNNSNKATKPNN
jgi:hypothetical protein